MKLLTRFCAFLLPRPRPAAPDPLLAEMRCRTAEHDARLRRLLSDEADVLMHSAGEERRDGA